MQTLQNRKTNIYSSKDLRRRKGVTKCKVNARASKLRVRGIKKLLGSLSRRPMRTQAVLGVASGKGCNARKKGHVSAIGNSKTKSGPLLLAGIKVVVVFDAQKSGLLSHSEGDK